MATEREFWDAVPDDILQSVGRVTIAFAQLEYIMAVVVKRLIGEGLKTGMAKAEELKFFDTIYTELKALLHEPGRDAESVKRLEATAAKADDLMRDRRHDVIHAVYFKDIDVPDGGFRIRRRKKVYLDIEALNELHAEVMRVRDELEEATHDPLLAR